MVLLHTTAYPFTTPRVNISLYQYIATRVITAIVPQVDKYNDILLGVNLDHNIENGKVFWGCSGDMYSAYFTAGVGFLATSQ